jgi:hypothetical protein
MRAKTVVCGVGIATLIAVPLWLHTRAGDRMDALAREIRAVRDSVGPVHTRCAALEEQLSGAAADLEQLAGAIDQLSYAVSDQDLRLASLRQYTERVHAELGVARAEARSRTEGMRIEREADAADIAKRKRRLTELEQAFAGLNERWDSMPNGTILPWLPSAGRVPSGWVVCDGSRGTPDLRGLFLRGAGYEGAGSYQPAGVMQPAGLHTHATKVNRSLYNLPLAPPKESGDWLILFDAGSMEADREEQAAHGLHVHEDEHVPEHFTVVYLMK